MNPASPCPYRHHAIPSRFFRLGLACLLAALTATAPAETPSNIMSRAMIAMMDSMGKLALQFKNRGGGSLGNGSPRYGLPNHYGPSRTFRHGPGHYYSPPPRGLSPIPSPAYAPLPGRSAVDGIWLGQGGELVLVMYGHFRIYASAERYRDGLFEILGDKLLMYDPRGNRRKTFDYRLEEGRMILRGPTGTLMLFKQLPIPIPSRNLFF